jgi:hypothetical protein
MFQITRFVMEDFVDSLDQTYLYRIAQQAVHGVQRIS